METKKFDPYKIITSISITGIFLAIGLFVCSIFGYIPMGRALLSIIAIIFIVCACCVLALPWVKKLMAKEFKKTSIAFLCLIGFCCIMWIVCVFVILSMLNTDTATFAKLVFLQIALIITIQFILIMIVTSVVVRLKKSMIPFQVIMYLSYAFIDFYLTGIIICLKITAEDGLVFRDGISMFVSLPMIFALTLAIVWAGAAEGILKAINRRKTREFLTVSTNEDFPQPQKEDPKQKLKQLTEMLKEGLITEEEFQQKRGDIMKDL